MILIIDNYDSFVYTLARYSRKAIDDTEEIKVIRNDKITVKEIKHLKPKAIIISPGPCAPKQAGICIDLIKELGSTIPILGVCLGHQAIAEAYGGKTVRAPAPVHGKASTITHNRTAPLFHTLPEKFKAGRYHSLMADIKNAPDLIANAHSDGIIMAMHHKTHPVFGIQFHPESTLTPNGYEIIENFLTFTYHSS